MFKDILVPDIAPGCEHGPADAAIALAERDGGHVALLILVDVPEPLPGQWAGMTADVYSRLHQEALTRARTRAEALRARYAQATVPVDVRIANAGAIYPQNAVTLHARHADISVLPHAPRDRPEVASAHDLFHDLLLHSGRPVLVVPDGTTLTAGGRAVIAWKPTREAARAVHDALPLLRHTDAVDVVVVDPEPGEKSYGEDPGADIAAHLARHGLRVEVVAKPRMNFSTAYAVLDHARSVGAGLLVAGGYGRSRFREFLLGGATRELLQGTHLPVLFSH